MGYRWFDRGRGFRPGYGRGLGWGRGFIPTSPYGYSLQSHMRQFPPPTYTRQHPYYAPQSPTSYQQQYQRPYQQPYQQQQSIQTTLTASHMNCAHFNNGICTLRGISVSANGPVCPSFIPRL